MTTRNIIACAGAALLLAAPFGAMANESDYTYLEARYLVSGDLETKLSDGTTTLSDNADYDGWNINMALGLTEHVFVRAAYSKLRDESRGDGETTLLSGGVGVRTAAGSEAQPADLFAVLSYESIESDSSQLSAEAKGFGITAGMRWAPFDSVEISPYVSYLNYGSLDELTVTSNNATTKVSTSDTDLDGFQYGVRAVFSINHSLAVTASYRTTKLDVSSSTGSADLDANDEISIGLRYYFATLATR